VATTAPSPKPVSITIPADYLEDARSAALVEMTNDSDALRTADPQDRDMSTVILQRSLRLLDPLLNATGEVELMSEQDKTSSPLVHMLEAQVRLLVERLRTATQYEPIPMGDVLDLAAQLRWAAEEAIRIDPELEHRLSPDEWRKAMD
jgi:hypothetical protein